jgi:hypothetical protein
MEAGLLKEINGYDFYLPVSCTLSSFLLTSKTEGLTVSHF